MKRARRGVWVAFFLVVAGGAAPAVADVTAPPSASAAPLVSGSSVAVPIGTIAPGTAVSSALPNKVRVADLVLSPPLATLGEEVSVSTTIVNETEGLLSNVAWELTLAEGVSRSGTIGLIPPHGKAVIETAFPASRIGEQDVGIAVDRGATLGEAPRERSDNEMRTRIVVVKPSTDAWATFAKQAAALTRPVLAVMKKDVCVVGTIQGPALTIRMLDVRSLDYAAMQAVMTDKGVDEGLATAVSLAVGTAFRAWAAEYRSVHPSAFPTFAKVTGPVAPTTKASFSLPPNTSPKGTEVLGTDDLEKILVTRMGTRASEPGAKPALRALAASVSAQLSSWAMTQPVAVKGSGNVAGNVGPVDNGTLALPKTGPCGHLP